MKRAPAYDYEKYDKLKYDEQYDKIISMMMGGLKGGEGELAADGGGAGPLAVSHRRELEKVFLLRWFGFSHRR